MSVRTSGIFESEEQVDAPPIGFFLRQRPILINLICLLVCWLTIVYNSYLITYLLNTLDQIYINYVCSSIVAFSACYAGGYLFVKIGLKLSLGGSSLMAFIAGCLTLAYGLQHQSGWLFLVIWQFLQFGISSAYMILYVSNSSVFPTLF